MSKEEDLKKQINIRLEKELYNFLVGYSKENFKTITGIIRELITSLYKEYKLPTIVDENGKMVRKN